MNSKVKDESAKDAKEVIAKTTKVNKSSKKDIKDTSKKLRSGNPQTRNEVVNEFKSRHSEASKIKAITLSKDGLNPVWLIPTMLGLFIIGIAWVVIFYMTAEIGGYPIPFLKYGNFVAGFGFILGGFGLATRWK